VLIPGIPGAPVPQRGGEPTGSPPPGSAAGEVDLALLTRAVELGRRGWGRVHPNPLVGCVVVQKGSVVGEGWHREFGGSHAEVEALRAAGERARGATVYVSLEPCAHHGKTPPCTLALQQAGVRRLVYGAADPGAGAGGGAVLREWGMEVHGPCFPTLSAVRENPGFFARAEGRGHVTLKLALSLDGRIAAAPGERTSISGPEAAAWVLDLRAGFDGILVGAGTVRTDNPRLTARGEIVPRVPPARIVLDSAASLDPGSALLDPSDGARVVVVVAQGADRDRTRGLEERGGEVVEVESGPGGVSIPAALKALADRGLMNLLCEGGGRLASALATADRVDRLHLLMAPLLLGEAGVPAFAGSVCPAAARGWRPVAPPVPLGADVLLTYDRGR
jgi:diaminohydroxyphosphoribosylaminopyrimidine deaminase / 5-amino-6-(5-phosphoribosylamino)uracil reductase